MRKMFLPLFVFLCFSGTVLASFSDVESNGSYTGAINWMQSNGVINGYPDGTFKPGNEINRAEFLKMLYGVLVDYDEYADSKSILLLTQDEMGSGMDWGTGFSDVPLNAWYSPYVYAAFADGLIVGYPNGTFKPGDSINIAEAFKIIMGAFFNVDDLYYDGVYYTPCYDDLTKNPNVDKNAWYWKYIYVADNLCIVPDTMIMGMVEYQFDPSAKLSREQMAELIYRAKVVKDWAVEGEYSEYSDQLAPKNVGEKQLFIDATVEATCMVFNAEDIYDPVVEIEAKKIYEKYGFDADDDVAMAALTQKYKNDEEVQDAVTAALEECAADLDDTADDITYCTDEPVVSDIGWASYPISPEYEHLGYLGEFFTAYDYCGEERVAELSSVEEGEYILGAMITLNPNAPDELVDILLDMGFVISDVEDKWTLSGTVDFEEMLKLMPYAENIATYDCVNCG